MTFPPRRRAVARLVLLAILPVLGCHASAGATHGAPAATGLSDERIAGVALLVNNAVLGDAALATRRAIDPDVQYYARRVQTDHASLNAALSEALGRRGIGAQDDATRSAALRDAALARGQRLATIGARAFDAAYVDADLQAHRELLDVVDQLLRDVRDPALRDYLAALRPALAAHFAHAEQLRATLAARAR